MSKKTRLLLLVGTLLLAAVFVVLYYTVDPSGAGWMPRCPFRWLTGWECPACGNQRALHALLHGQWMAAWHHNPFLWLSMPYLVLLMAARLVRHKRPRPYSILAHPKVVMTYVALICLWWVLRNVV